MATITTACMWRTSHESSDIQHLQTDRGTDLSTLIQTASQSVGRLQSLDGIFPKGMKLKCAMNEHGTISKEPVLYGTHIARTERGSPSVVLYVLSRQTSSWSPPRVSDASTAGSENRLNASLLEQKTD